MSSERVIFTDAINKMFDRKKRYTAFATYLDDALPPLLYRQGLKHLTETERITLGLRETPRQTPVLEKEQAESLETTVRQFCLALLDGVEEMSEPAVRLQDWAAQEAGREVSDPLFSDLKKLVQEWTRTYQADLETVPGESQSRAA